MNRFDPGRFSNSPVVAGAPRPDVSVYQGGRLVKIAEMKFPTKSGGVDGRGCCT
jgi:hypothetical protein